MRNKIIILIILLLIIISMIYFFVKKDDSNVNKWFYKSTEKTELIDSVWSSF
jgi:uncharacterized protein YxeA